MLPNSIAHSQGSYNGSLSLTLVWDQQLLCKSLLCTFLNHSQLPQQFVLRTQVELNLRRLVVWSPRNTDVKLPFVPIHLWKQTKWYNLIPDQAVISYLLCYSWYMGGQYEALYTLGPLLTVLEWGLTSTVSEQCECSTDIIGVSSESITYQPHQRVHITHQRIISCSWLVWAHLE